MGERIKTENGEALTITPTTPDDAPLTLACDIYTVQDKITE